MGEMANRHDLVSAARAGEGDAFMELVRIETPEAFRLTLAILRHPADAEDALQEAFVRAWRELPSLRSADRWSALENDDGHREVSAREPGARVGPAPAKPWF
jgi:hypothetical protein